MNGRRAEVVAALAEPDEERRLLLLWLVAHVLIWLALPVLFGDVPGDNLEELDWATRPALGYDKHPPLPALLLWLFARVLPLGNSLTFLLGALQVSVMLTCAWHVSRATLGESGAWRGTVLVALATYYSLRLHYHNHNTMVLACYAGAVLCTWEVARHGTARWWLALGLCWGAGMLSKYQMVVGIAANAWYLARCGSLAPRRWITGIAAAGAVAALLFAPHVVWLFQHRFPTFRYASGSLLADLPWLDRPWEVLRFGLQQAWRLAPPALVVLLTWRRPRGSPVAAPSVSPKALQFLRVHALGPFLLMGALALLTGTELMAHWGTSFLWMLPLWFAATPAGAQLRGQELTGFLEAAVAAQALLVAWYLVDEFRDILLTALVLDF